MKWENEEEVLLKYSPLVDLVVAQLKRKLSNQADEQELVSFGMVGLWDAAQKFNPEQGVKFETYAAQRIRGEILDGLRQTDSVSRTLRAKEKKVKAAVEELEQLYLRRPTSQEMSQHLGISIQEYKQLQLQLSFIKQQSLDEPLGEGEEQSKTREAVDHYYPKQEEWLEEKEQKQRLAELIDTLPAKEKLVLSLVYFENLSLTDVSRVMDLHKSRISQLHSQAIKRLRTMLTKEELAL